MNYTDLVANLTNLLQATGSTDFTAILPALIADGENRIYREIDFLTTRTTNTATCASGSRNVTCPANIIIVEGVSVISPSGSAPAAGTRNNLERVSLDFIDLTWPQESVTGLPLNFAMKSDTAVVVSPTPDANYTAEFTGIYRPAPISASNPTTWLATNLPDLLLASCMIFGSAYQRDFGAMSDNPQMAVSWESHYQALKQGAVEEEQRRKDQGVNWTPFSQTPASTPRT